MCVNSVVDGWLETQEFFVVPIASQTTQNVTPTLTIYRHQIALRQNQEQFAEQFHR